MVHIGPLVVILVLLAQGSVVSRSFAMPQMCHAGYTEVQPRSASPPWVSAKCGDIACGHLWTSGKLCKIVRTVLNKAVAETASRIASESAPARAQDVYMNNEVLTDS